MTARLTHKDLRFRVSDTLFLPGSPFGEDEYFICYGHGYTAVDLANYVELYYMHCGLQGQELTMARLDAFANGIRERWARVINPEDHRDEWMISWSDNDSNADDTFPITIMSM